MEKIQDHMEFLLSAALRKCGNLQDAENHGRRYTYFIIYTAQDQKWYLGGELDEAALHHRKRHREP